MSTDTDELEFLEELVKQLDATIRELARHEQALAARHGPDRVGELRALWRQTLDPQDARELACHLDWRDRELVWVWSRLERAHANRAAAGTILMRNSPPSGCLDN